MTFIWWIYKLFLTLALERLAGTHIQLWEEKPKAQPGEHNCEKRSRKPNLESTTVRREVESPTWRAQLWEEKPKAQSERSTREDCVISLTRVLDPFCKNISQQLEHFVNVHLYIRIQCHVISNQLYLYLKYICFN